MCGKDILDIHNLSLVRILTTELAILVSMNQLEENSQELVHFEDGPLV